MALPIPLDPPVKALTQDIRSDLGLDDFGSARNTPPLGGLGRIAGRVLRPIAVRALRLVGFRSR